jgi:HK97 gp10 family phage protein
MASKITVKVDGLRDLQAALAELPKATQTAVLKRTLLKAAEPIVTKAKELAPVRTGALRKSIRAVAQSKGGQAGKAAFHATMKAGGTRKEAAAAARAANRANPSSADVVVLIGPARLPYAHMVEFGTSEMGPQPYMRPAWDANRERVLESIKADLANEITKTVARRARRAAKRAAKG